MTTIKKQFLKTKLCPYQQRGYCFNGSSCSYAHADMELKPLPDLRQTKMCDYTKKGFECPKRDQGCSYAHDIVDLRPSTDLATFKTSMCFFWRKGKCFNGEKCRFAHGLTEVRANPTASEDSASTNTKKSDQRSGEQTTVLSQSNNRRNSTNTSGRSNSVSLNNSNNNSGLPSGPNKGSLNPSAPVWQPQRISPRMGSKHQSGQAAGLGGAHVPPHLPPHLFRPNQPPRSHHHHHPGFMAAGAVPFPPYSHHVPLHPHFHPGVPHHPGYPRLFPAPMVDELWQRGWLMQAGLPTKEGHMASPGGGKKKKKKKKKKKVLCVD
eukprot:Selendium_serpulae@DN3432_c0_g1_i1.p1